MTRQLTRLVSSRLAPSGNREMSMPVVNDSHRAFSLVYSQLSSCITYRFSSPHHNPSWCLSSLSCLQAASNPAPLTSHKHSALKPLCSPCRIELAFPPPRPTTRIACVPEHCHQVVIGRISGTHGLLLSTFLSSPAIWVTDLTLVLQENSNTLTLFVRIICFSGATIDWVEPTLGILCSQT